jgi:hypothetical protein
LIREDLPTFDRPMKANSGSAGDGFLSVRVLLPANRAETIFISFLQLHCKDRKKSLYFLLNLQEFQMLCDGK